jgi:putative ABC transport system permease protein
MILLRLLLQTVVLAIGQLWVNRVRALLTTAGIVIGVASTIAIVGAVDGLSKFVIKEFESLGATRFVIFGRTPREAPGRFSPQQVQLKVREVEGILRAAPAVARLTPVKGFPVQVQFGERVERNVRVSGMRNDWHLIEAREVIAGRPFSPIDEEERRSVCMVNDHAIQELNLPSDPSGQSILLAGRRFLIVGVVETKSLPSAFGGGDPLSEVFIPFATAEAWKPEPVFGIFAQGTTTKADGFADAEAEITRFLRTSRGLQPADPDTFAIRGVEQFVSQLNRLTFGLTVAAAGIVSISLLVGGVGIMNIMLASVSERTREIGLRKAVGARPGVILMQFLVEAVVLCLVGAAIGLLLGWGAVQGLRAIPNSPLAQAVVPTWAIILATGSSALTGLVFGMFPAIKASRLDPIEALRHE